MFYRLSFGSEDSNPNDVGAGTALGVLIFVIVGLGALPAAVFIMSESFK